jgi:putative endonuclease
VKPGSALAGRRALGAAGESFAAAYLIRRGYALLARNWRCALGEIDLIARDGETLVFVEVRTRRSLAFGGPEESLTRAKRARLVRLAYGFLSQQPEPAGEWRIDLIAILIGPEGRPALNHLTHLAGEP